MTERAIYFLKPIGMIGPIKIGCTSYPGHRLSQISMWSPIPLEMIASAEGSHQLERWVHDQFAAYRSHKEWFHPTPRLMIAIHAVAAGSSIEAAFGAHLIKDSRAKYGQRYVTSPAKSLPQPIEAVK